MDPELLVRLLDRSQIQELRESFELLDFPGDSVSLCRHIVENFSRDATLQFINEKSGNWHHYIYLHPLRRNISNAILQRVHEQIDLPENMVYLGTFDQGVFGLNFIVTGNKRISIEKDERVNFRNEIYGHVLKVWTRNNTLVLHISTFETSFRKWVNDRDAVVFNRGGYISYDGYDRELLDALQGAHVSVNHDPRIFQSSAKQLFIQDRYKTNGSVIRNEDDGQSIVTKAQMKFYYSQADESGPTPIRLKEAFENIDREHLEIYSFWRFNNFDYKVTLYPEAGMIKIINHLSFYDRCDLIKNIIDLI